MNNLIDKSSTDVLIIGGGLTGHIAALELTNAGYAVSMLRCGFGASPGVSGFNIPCAEKDDSIEKFIEDTKISGRDQGDEKLVSKLCNNALNLEKYLEQYGFEFDHNQDGSLKSRKSLGSSYARVVGHGNGSGGQILNVVREKLNSSGKFFDYLNVRALRLITDNDKVVGAYCFDENKNEFVTIYAKACLLSSGGFAGIFPFTSNSKDISGDGMSMALNAGCSLIDLEFVQFEPSSAVWPLEIKGKGMITTLFYEGAIMKNGKGERFMLKYGPQAECVNKDVLSHAIEKEIMAGNATPHGGVWFDASGVDEARLHDAYEPFVQRYAQVGINLCKEPVELANAAHTTLGGVKIDENCRSELKGLYVAGESAGHLHGANRIGGSAGSETLVFGQEVAKSIKEDINNFELNIKDYSFLTGESNALNEEEIDNYASKVKEVLGKSCGVYRNLDDLTKGYEELEKIYTTVRNSSLSNNNELDYKRIRLENNLCTARALILACMTRNDSCGCHQRIDYPLDPTNNYHTEVKLINNELNVSKINN